MEFIVSQSIPACACLLVWVAMTAASATEWPGELPSEVLWYWGHLDQPGMIEDAEGHWVRDCDVRLRGRTRPNWFLGADVQHGSLHALDMGMVIAEALNRPQPLYVEMALHPHGLEGQTGVLLSVGPVEGPARLELVLNDHRLLLKRQGADPLDLGELHLASPTHLAVSIDHAQIVWWRDGLAQDKTPWSFTPIDIDAELELSFGGRLSGDGGWRGVVEAIVLAEAPRDVVQATALWRGRHAQRSAPVSTTVEAVLVAHAQEPDPRDLMDYDECILAAVWRIERHVAGPRLDAEQVLTWHWYQLDRVVMDDARPPEPGARRVLRLGPEDGHPEIASIQRVDTGLDPGQLLELDAYLIVHDGLTAP